MPPELLERAAAVMKAIGHPLRLRILELLGAEREAGVTAICAALRAGQPLVSQQLGRMRLEGILAARREGAQVFYSVARPEVLGVLDCIRRMGKEKR